MGLASRDVVVRNSGGELGYPPDAASVAAASFDRHELAPHVLGTDVHALLLQRRRGLGLGRQRLGIAAAATVAATVAVASVSFPHPVGSLVPPPSEERHDAGFPDPDVKGTAPHLADVDAQLAVYTAALYAHEHAKVERRPVRVNHAAVGARVVARGQGP